MEAPAQQERPRADYLPEPGAKLTESEIKLMKELADTFMRLGDAHAECVRLQGQLEEKEKLLDAYRIHTMSAGPPPQDAQDMVLRDQLRHFTVEWPGGGEEE